MCCMDDYGVRKREIEISFNRQCIKINARHKQLSEDHYIFSKELSIKKDKLEYDKMCEAKKIEALRDKDIEYLKLERLSDSLQCETQEQHVELDSCYQENRKKIIRRAQESLALIYEEYNAALLTIEKQQQDETNSYHMKCDELSQQKLAARKKYYEELKELNQLIKKA